MRDARQTDASWRRELIPDIGDFKDVPIIEIHVKEGDAINAEDPLLIARVRQGHHGSAGSASGTVENTPGQDRRQGQRGHPDLARAGGDGAITQPPSLFNQQEPKPDLQDPSPESRPPAQSARRASRSARDRRRRADGGQLRAGRMRARACGVSPRELEVDLNKIRDWRKGPDHPAGCPGLPARPWPPRQPRRRPPAAWASPIIPAQDFSKFWPCHRNQPAALHQQDLWGRTCTAPGSNVPHVTHNDARTSRRSTRIAKELDTAVKDKGFRRHPARLPDEGLGVGPAAVPAV